MGVETKDVYLLGMIKRGEGEGMESLRERGGGMEAWLGLLRAKRSHLKALL